MRLRMLIRDSWVSFFKAYNNDYYDGDWCGLKATIVHVLLALGLISLLLAAIATMDSLNRGVFLKKVIPLVVLYGLSLFFLTLPAYEYSKKIYRKNKRAFFIFWLKYFMPTKEIPLYLNHPDEGVRDIVNTLLKKEA